LFTATEVLAKHDENYMPPEVARTLEEKTPHGKQDAPAKSDSAY
jgi:cytochrome c-type biogenesis protein CcmE